MRTMTTMVKMISITLVYKGNGSTRMMSMCQEDHVTMMIISEVYERVLG